MAHHRAATTPEQRERFLAKLVKGLTITDACKAAGIARRTAYDIRQRDEDFALAWADAVEQGTDVYEREAYRRAIEGTERPVMYQGEVVEHVREYSDRLLELMLKARRPHIYREHVSVEHSGRIDRPSADELRRAREAGMDPEVEAAAALIASLGRDDEDAG